MKKDIDTIDQTPVSSRKHMIYNKVDNKTRIKLLKIVC